MTDEELAALIDRIAAETGMGGLGVGTLYGDFALDVANAVRERCAQQVIDACAWTGGHGEPSNPGSHDLARIIRGQN